MITVQMSALIRLHNLLRLKPGTQDTYIIASYRITTKFSLTMIITDYITRYRSLRKIQHRVMRKFFVLKYFRRS